MFETRKLNTITMIEMRPGGGLSATIYTHRAVAEVKWPVVRFRSALGDNILVNVASAWFVKAEPMPDEESLEPRPGPR